MRAWRMLSVDRDGMSVPMQVDFTDQLTSDSPIGARVKHLEHLTSVGGGANSASDAARVMAYWEAAAGSGIDTALRIRAWLAATAIPETGCEVRRAVDDGIHFLTLYITRRQITDRIRGERAEFLRSNGFDDPGVEA